MRYNIDVDDIDHETQGHGITADTFGECTFAEAKAGAIAVVEDRLTAYQGLLEDIKTLRAADIEAP